VFPLTAEGDLACLYLYTAVFNKSETLFTADARTLMRKRSSTPSRKASVKSKGKVTRGSVPQGTSRGLGQRAYDKLIGAIEEGSLTSCSTIVEGEIAEWLGMSRTPVREALQRLVSEGLLVHGPRVGLALAQLDYQGIVELYRMREVLEGAAAAFAAQHATDTEIAILRELCAGEKTVAGDPVLGARHNRRFHQTIYQGSHNRYLIRSLNSLATSLALLGNYTRLIAGRAEQACREHADIVEAIASRDVMKAQEVARAHIRSAQQARLQDISGVPAGNQVRI
jgi:DNA-binding GntR family transcriptional regulator